MRPEYALLFLRLHHALTKRHPGQWVLLAWRYECVNCKFEAMWR